MVCPLRLSFLVFLQTTSPSVTLLVLEVRLTTESVFASEVDITYSVPLQGLGLWLKLGLRLELELGLGLGLGQELGLGLGVGLGKG